MLFLRDSTDAFREEIFEPLLLLLDAIFYKPRPTLRFTFAPSSFVTSNAAIF
jgi:hypothetical protein